MSKPLKSFKATVIFLSALAVGLLAYSHSPASADLKGDTLKAIQMQYNKYCKAQDAKKIDGVMAIFASDFVQTGFQPGKTTYEQYRAQKLKRFAAVASIQSHIDIEAIRVKGDVATVSIHEGDAVVDLPKPNDKDAHGGIGDSWRTETWIKKKGVWLLSRSKIGF